MGDQTIGEVQIVNLHAYREEDIRFDVEWWEEDGITPRNIESFKGEITTTDEEDAEVILSLASWGTILNNVLTIEVPKATVAQIVQRSGVWVLALTEAVTSDNEVVCRGKFKLFGRKPVTP